MLRLKDRVLVFFSALLLSSYSLAAADSNTAPWKFEVAPYIWAINMNGAAQIGPYRARVDESFGDILRQMNFGGMLWVDGAKDKWGVFGNAMYSILEKNESVGSASIDSKAKFGIFSAGVSYEVYKTCFSESCNSSAHSFDIQPYMGLRYTVNDLTMTVNTPIFNIQATNNHNWTDPIVGARMHYMLNKSWLALVAGDVGGTNTANHYSYNLIGLIGYKPQTMLTSTTLYAGYRLLDEHYETGSGTKYFNWNMKMFGPVVGFSIAL